MTEIIETAPEGTLKYQTRDGVTYYYLQKKNPETEKWEKICLKKSQSDLVKQLAQKSYLQKAKRVLEEQIQALTHFISIYNEASLEQIYDNLPNERKELITPITHSIKERLKEWNEEIYKPYNAYSEFKIYETDRGEMVRSKSEVIIANLLNQQKRHLDYKYERPLELRDKNGREIIIYPDFTKKMELYTINNIMQGKELLITYEAAGAPLSISCVRKIVEMCFE